MENGTYSWPPSTTSAIQLRHDWLVDLWKLKTSPQGYLFQNSFYFAVSVFQNRALILEKTSLSCLRHWNIKVSVSDIRSKLIAEILQTAPIKYVFSNQFTLETHKYRNWKYNFCNNDLTEIIWKNNQIRTIHLLKLSSQHWSHRYSVV